MWPKFGTKNRGRVSPQRSHPPAWGPARECREGFRKFPTTTNPREIVAHVGALLAHEAAERSPATPLTNRLRQVKFRFNEKLAKGAFVLTPQQRDGANDDAASGRLVSSQQMTARFDKLAQ